jgi:hypothetical protein
MTAKQQSDGRGRQRFLAGEADAIAGVRHERPQTRRCQTAPTRNLTTGDNVSHRPTNSGFGATSALVARRRHSSLGTQIEVVARLPLARLALLLWHLDHASPELSSHLTIPTMRVALPSAN